MPWAQTCDLVRMPRAHRWTILRIHWYHTCTVVKMLCIIGRLSFENCYLDLMSKLWRCKTLELSQIPYEKNLEANNQVQIRSKIYRNWPQNIESTDAHFGLQKYKSEEVMKTGFQIQNKRPQSWLQKRVLAVCDAIWSSWQMSKQIGYIAKEHLHIIKALNSVTKSRDPSSNGDAMTWARNTCKHKTDERRSEANLRHISWLVS